MGGDLRHARSVGASDLGICRSEDRQLIAIDELASVLREHPESPLNYVDRRVRERLVELRDHGLVGYVYAPRWRANAGRDNLAGVFDQVRRADEHRCLHPDCKDDGGAVIPEEEYGVRGPRGSRRTLCESCAADGWQGIASTRGDDHFRYALAASLRQILNGGTTERLKLVREHYPGVQCTTLGRNSFESVALATADVAALRELAELLERAQAALDD